jgi:hypothetical protein
LVYAFVYYGEIFEIFCSVANERCKDGVSSVAILREICNDSNELKVLKTGLSYIHAKSSFLSQPIKKLRGFGPLANYAGRATAASWRSITNFCG